MSKIEVKNKQENMLNKKKITYKKTAENIFHLSSSLEDVLYSSPLFSIQQEEVEIIRSKRTRIEYKLLTDITSNSWVTPLLAQSAKLHK